MTEASWTDDHRHAHPAQTRPGGKAPADGRPTAQTGGSLWEETAPPIRPFSKLAGSIDTDVLVVGGGLAGASTAFHLAEAGVSVALVEARGIGSGATGQSGGLIAPDYIRHTPESIRRAIGQAEGERLTRFIGESGAATFALAKRLGLDCDARAEGFWTPAHTAALAETQRALASQWSIRGFRVSYVDAAETQRGLGTDRYLGALRFDDGGSLNPLALARGLAAAAAAAGAQCFADSPITSLERRNARWDARVPDGRIRARRLVLAANGGNAALHPGLARTVLPLDVVQFATVPLDAARRARVLPGASGGFTDKAPYIFTARYDGHGHLISAFPASIMVRGDKDLYREARRRLTRHFPVLAGVEIHALWRGQAWINPSLLPALYDLGDDAIAIQACNGRGLPTNTILGRDVANWLAFSADVLPVQLRPPRAVRMHRFARLIPAALMAMAQIGSRRG